jgi:ketosteroid isomerase-like protein
MHHRAVQSIKAHCPFVTLTIVVPTNTYNLYSLRTRFTCSTTRFMKERDRVRFQFSEIVEHPDPDLVLHILEHCFRDISLEVVHSGDQLTVYGVGPSFRTMNRNDKTVLRASRQQTATIIHAEVNFLASALMGDMPQDTVVRSKIEQAVRCMKTQLNLDVAFPPEDPPSIHSSEPTQPFPPEPPAPPVPEAAGPPAHEPLVLENTSFQTATATIAAEPFIQPPTMEPNELIALESNAPVATVPPAFAVAAPSAPPEHAFDSAASASAPPQPFLPMKAGPAEQKRSALLPLTVLAALILLGTGYLLQHRNPGGNLFSLKNATEHATPDADQPAVEQTNSAPPHDAVKQSSSPSAQSSQTPTAAGPENIRAWVEDWAAAMRTSDPKAQISFYADPVNRYFLTPNVGKSELMREKQSDIASRKGLWTFKAENVEIERQTESNAIVLLTKHITVKPPSSSSIREQRIKTQLKLKIVDGNWKIISERTLGWG